MENNPVNLKILRILILTEKEASLPYDRSGSAMSILIRPVMSLWS